MLKNKLILICNFITVWHRPMLVSIFCISIFFFQISNYFNEKRKSVFITQELIREKFSSKNCILSPDKIKWACQNSNFKCFFDGEQTLCEMQTESGILNFRLQDEVDVDSIKK